MDDRRRFSAFVPKDKDPRSAILQATEFAREFMTECDLDPQLKVKIAIIVEELASNALRYGGKANDLSLWLSLSEIDGSVALEVEDDGAQFDPTSRSSFNGPDPNTGGGIGLAFVRAWGEEIAYSRVSERNTLKLIIR